MYCLLQLILAFLVCSAWCADGGGIEEDGFVFNVPHVLQRHLGELEIWKERCADFSPDAGPKCEISSVPGQDTVELTDQIDDQKILGCDVSLVTDNPQDLLGVYARMGGYYEQMVDLSPTCSIVFQPEGNGGFLRINNKLSGEEKECCFINNVRQPNLVCAYGIYKNCMTITRFLTEYDDESKFFVRISVNYENLHKFVVQWGTRGDGHQEDCPEEIVHGVHELDQNVEDMDVD